MKTTHEWKWMFEKNVKCSQIIGFQVGEPLKNNYNDVDTMAILFYIVLSFLSTNRYMVQLSLYPT